VGCLVDAKSKLQLGWSPTAGATVATDNFSNFLNLTVSSSVHTCCTPGIWESFGEQLVEPGDALAQKQNSCPASIKT
jgi:hypothetical protein